MTAAALVIIGGCPLIGQVTAGALIAAGVGALLSAVADVVSGRGLR